MGAHIEFEYKILSPATFVNGALVTLLTDHTHRKNSYTELLLYLIRKIEN
jgi:hypothetical protein